LIVHCFFAYLHDDLTFKEIESRYKIGSENFSVVKIQVDGIWTKNPVLNDGAAVKQGESTFIINESELQFDFVNARVQYLLDKDDLYSSEEELIKRLPGLNILPPQEIFESIIDLADTTFMINLSVEVMKFRD
jgi:hypothetical protein